jgi:hypothetical protein
MVSSRFNVTVSPSGGDIAAQNEELDTENLGNGQLGKSKGVHGTDVIGVLSDQLLHPVPNPEQPYCQATVSILLRE